MNNDKFKEKLDEMLKERLKNYRLEEFSINQINEMDRLAPGKTKISTLCTLKEGGIVGMKFEFPSSFIQGDLAKIWKESKGDKL